MKQGKMDGRVRSLRGSYTQLMLRGGNVVLTAYAVAGAFVGVEIFTFLAVWPLSIALGIAALVGARLVLRRRSRMTRNGEGP